MAPTDTELRTFHLTGQGMEAFLLRGSLHPSSIDMAELPALEEHYPLYVGGEEAPLPVLRVLQNVVNAQPLRFPILRDCLASIAAAMGVQIGQRGCAPIASVLEGALAAVRGQLESAGLEAEIAALAKAMPRNGWLIGFGSGTLELLACFAICGAQKQARARFVDELHVGAERLRELLALDDRLDPGASSAGSVAASLGSRSAAFFNSEALAEALRRRTNATQPMNAERRARCEQALHTLQNAVADWQRMPAIVLLHAAGVAEIPAELGVETRRVEDACAAALELRREQMEHQLTVWKALRIARLEVESSFDAAAHPAALTGFDWRMAQAHELSALPAVLVSEAADAMERQAGAFVHLLKSGLPVQVLITFPDGRSDWSTLPLGYPEAFALHSTLGATEHLAAGLREMAQSVRPAVAMVAVSAPWTGAALLGATRRFALYRYNPGLGHSWRERFTMQTELAARYEAVNAAQVAALLPDSRQHFRLLPDGVNLAPAFPFVMLSDQSGAQHRAVLTRELADNCDAAERNWRMLAELATPKVVTQVNTDAEQSARVAGATEAVQRVIAMLTRT